MKLAEILTLTPDGSDAFTGVGPRYPWGGLYGGQIVAQALLAAAATVGPSFTAHSLRAYFIRRGDHDESVHYEVDRIRDGRSYVTRRVVARQGIGAILNLEASFSVDEASADIETVRLSEGLPGPNNLDQSSWTPTFERAFVEADLLSGAGRAGEGRAGEGRAGAGRALAWMRVVEDLGADPLLWQAAFAFLSDDLPTDAVVRAHPVGSDALANPESALFTASLDHTIWFHRPFRPDRWHVHDFSCQTFVGARGLAAGHVFDRTGTHVATVAQEVLLRETRRRITSNEVAGRPRGE